MKKILFVIMSCIAMTFAACGNGTTKCETPVNDSDSIAVVDTTVVDSIVEVADTVVAE